MITWIKTLLWDETAFVRYARAGLMGLGALGTYGTLELPEWLSVACMAAAVFVGSTTQAKVKEHKP